jgi:hypothetical protein
MAFGGRNNGSANWFNGDISNVRTYSTQLTADHATALYNSGNGTESTGNVGTVATVNFDDNNISLPADDTNILIGAAGDATISYNGTNLVIDPQAVGSGGLVISNMKSGATQGGAGAEADELWKTTSHATLPDNVVMIGV